MKIIIVGAGEVGYNIANRLASENKQVVVIDQDSDACRHISEDLDVQVITGSGSSPAILLEAGIKDTDILLAVTDSDEINLVACLVTNLLSPTTKKLARIRNSDFDAYHDSFKNQIPHIDTVINPEIEVVNTIRKLMDVPDAQDIGHFADGKIKYVGLRLKKNSPIAGMRLIDFHDNFGEDRPLIAAIIRDNEVIVPRGTHRIEAQDLVYFVCEAEKLEKTLKLFGIQQQTIQNALIIDRKSVV